MSVWFTVLSLLAIVVLTAGTALFVAAEFSLTALERSTVDANARNGDRRDKFVQKAHRTLSFQDRKSTRLNSSHGTLSRMPSSA